MALVIGGYKRNIGSVNPKPMRYILKMDFSQNQNMAKTKVQNLEKNDKEISPQKATTIFLLFMNPFNIQMVLSTCSFFIQNEDIPLMPKGETRQSHVS